MPTTPKASCALRLGPPELWPGAGREAPSSFRDGDKTGCVPTSFTGLKGADIQLRRGVGPWVLVQKPGRGLASVSLLGGLQQAMDAWSGEQNPGKWVMCSSVQGRELLP